MRWFTLALVALQQTGLQSRLDPVTYQAIRPVLEAAARDSLPVRALEAKALEGAAKQRPAGQIAAAVRQLADDLRSARTLLRAAAPADPLPDGDVVAAAMARRQGVPADDIGSLRRVAPTGTALEIPFALLGELVQRGVPVDQSYSVIEHLVTSGVPPERMVEIPQRLDVALRVGAPPITALGTALQSLGIPVPPVGPGRPRPGRPPVP